MTYILLFLAFWLACGFVAAGRIFAELCAVWPEFVQDRRRELNISLWIVAIGCAPFCAIAIRSRHGWRKWW